ncbi:Pentatricopeptide repeat-containing protein -mitochondrial [Striga hermonthica]|uniref:Pentatricopeptide repeat-containing protein -mitochondrial n=1 Tax=Striga hermonthica TaxID=68872 RepID=A0A9N7R681_STRHE|nr:Pentatricopeptide repeat-containing protein -mitochondrial [Striga hermonthica]
MSAALNRLLCSRSTNIIAFRKSFSCALAAQADLIPSANAPKYSASRARNLFSRINSVRKDNDVVRVLDEWVAEGRHVHPLELRPIIRHLRSRRRFSQALKISEWISSNHAFKFISGDFAVHLDLIGVVQGWESAEGYFANLNEQYKNEKTYGALLNCYVRQGLLTKALDHMHAMKELGYSSSTLTYNNLMALYKKEGKLDKIVETLSEMKKNGISPNNFSYRICISSFGEKSDVDSMEKLLDEMELQADVDIDWSTCSVVAYQLIKNGREEKALAYMKKLEAGLDKDALGYNHLISLYAHLGNKDEMLRLWALQKRVCKKQNNWDYINMLGCLLKLGEFDAAEVVLKEWESCCHTYDFRVPNTLLIGYCQKGLVEKAEIMLRDIMEKGERPTPNSWGIIGAGYLDEGNFRKAFECVKEAVGAKERNLKWRPKPGLIAELLSWLGDEEEYEEVDAFVRSVSAVVPVNREMYCALIKAGLRAGKDIGSILDRMKGDGIGVDVEIEEMIGI